MLGIGSLETLGILDVAITGGLDGWICCCCCCFCCGADIDFIYIEVFGSVRIDAGVKVFGNKMNCEQNETKRDEKQNSRKETSEGWTGKGGKEEYS